MTKAIFIASMEPHTGKSVVVLGLTNWLLSKTRQVGCFKPIIEEPLTGQKEGPSEAILDDFKLPIPFEDTFAFTREEALGHMKGDVVS